jgi:hypothetical protein
MIDLQKTFKMSIFSLHLALADALRGDYEKYSVNYENRWGVACPL